MTSGLLKRLRGRLEGEGGLQIDPPGRLQLLHNLKEFEVLQLQCASPGQNTARGMRVCVLAYLSFRLTLCVGPAV